MEADDTMSRLIAAQERIAIAMEGILAVVQKMQPAIERADRQEQQKPKGPELWRSRAMSCRTELLKAINDGSLRFPSLREIARRVGFPSKYLVGQTTHPELAGFVSFHREQEEAWKSSASRVELKDYEMEGLLEQFGEDEDVREFLLVKKAGGQPSEKLLRRLKERGISGLREEEA